MKYKKLFLFLAFGFLISTIIYRDEFNPLGPKISTGILKIYEIKQ